MVLRAHSALPSKITVRMLPRGFSSRYSLWQEGSVSPRMKRMDRHYLVICDFLYCCIFFLLAEEMDLITEDYGVGSTNLKILCRTDSFLGK